VTAAKVKIMGVALGNIIATIMTAHMTKSGNTETKGHEARSGPPIFIATSSQTPLIFMRRASENRCHHATPATIPSPHPTINRSRFSTEASALIRS